ncbi:MAG: helix-turn-helix domain-containing protein [Cyanobacteria bacterium]|nr:helix-turn-helix domain-containing protein [Cyanobacteriota bacterium]
MEDKVVNTASSLSVAGEPLWSTKKLANYLDCAEVTVRSWRRTGLGPKYVRVTNRQVRYRLSDIQEWLAKKPTLTNTSAAV